MAFTWIHEPAGGVPNVTLTEIPQKPSSRVSFVVVCSPRPGLTVSEISTKLSLETVDQFIPDCRTRGKGIAALKARGFTVYNDDPSPVVSAQGTVNQFQQLFKTRLQCYRRDFRSMKGVSEAR